MLMSSKFTPLVILPLVTEHLSLIVWVVSKGGSTVVTKRYTKSLDIYDNE